MMFYIKIMVLLILSAYLHEVGHWLAFRSIGVKSDIGVNRTGFYCMARIRRKINSFEFFLTKVSGGIFSGLCYIMLYLITLDDVVLFIAGAQIICGIVEYLREWKIK